MNKFINLCKKNIGMTALICLVLIILIFTFIYLFNSRNVSEIEKKELDKKTKNIINFIDDIASSKSDKIDKYIIFALDYSYNMNSKNNMTVKEVTDFLNNHFTVDITEDDIKNIGITEEMVEKNIVYDSNKELFTIKVVPKSGSSLANDNIVYLKRNNIIKINKKKYKIYYYKYVIENPYDMLNYYLDSNINDNDSNYDVTVIRNYLMGSASIGSLLNSINENDIKMFAKKDKKIVITYIVDGDNLLIDKIK